MKEMKKKKNSIIIIVGLLILAILPNISIEVSGQSSDPFVFVFGTSYGPQDLDPHYAWDSASIDVILKTSPVFSFPKFR